MKKNEGNIRLAYKSMTENRSSKSSSLGNSKSAVICFIKYFFLARSCQIVMICFLAGGGGGGGSSPSTLMIVPSALGVVEEASVRVGPLLSPGLLFSDSTAEVPWPTESEGEVGGVVRVSEGCPDVKEVSGDKRGDICGVSCSDINTL